jgi:hypothetical protein
MKALVHTTHVVNYVSSTQDITDDNGNVIFQKNIFSDLPNSALICQIEEDSNTFEVHPDFIWVDCDASVTPASHYYDTSDSTIKAIPSAS